jgi:hypothetical protein
MLGVKLERLQFQMVGSRSLADQAVKNAILEVMLAHSKFVPEQWGYEERGGDKFSREEVLKATPIPGLILHFRRRRGIRQHLLLNLGKRTNVDWKFEPPPDSATWPEIFGMTEELALAYQPDFGVVKTRVEMKLDPSNEDSRTQYFLNSPVDCSPVWYRKDGVLGLGTRTIFGPLTANQVDRDRLRSLPAPAVVRDLEWGGVLVDLVREPWTREMSELRTSWVACMKHLMPSNFFTKANILPDGNVQRVLPQTPAWDPGGLVK